MKVTGISTGLAASIAGLAVGCVGTRHNQNANRTYQNPVFAGDMPDPSVKRFRKFYYAAGTPGAKAMADGRVFRLLRSTNLVHWEELAAGAVRSVVG